MARTLALAQEKMGDEVRVIAVQADRFRSEADEVLQRSGLLGWNLAVRALKVDWPSIDVLHIHGGVWRTQLYYYLLRRRTPHTGWIIHLHGSETRSGKGLHHLGLADALLCATPDLRRYVPYAEWLPNPVLLPEAPPPLLPGPRVILGHFPSDRRVKGTDLIVRALENEFGPPRGVSRDATSVARYSWDAFDLLIADQIPHKEVLERMESCHAIVDHLSELGAVSLVALEAMARGRAALSSLDRDVYPPDCPVIQITPDSAGSVFRAVLSDPDWIRRAGESGRRYVENYHRPMKIAERATEVYAWARERRRR